MFPICCDSENHVVHWMSADLSRISVSFRRFPPQRISVDFRRFPPPRGAGAQGYEGGSGGSQTAPQGLRWLPEVAALFGHSMVFHRVWGIKGKHLQKITLSIEVSRAARRGMGPGFGTSAARTFKIRVRFSFWSTKMRLHESRRQCSLRRLPIWGTPCWYTTGLCFRTWRPTNLHCHKRGLESSSGSVNPTKMHNKASPTHLRLGVASILPPPALPQPLPSNYPGKE
jgi:hypothetical protein